MREGALGAVLTGVFATRAVADKLVSEGKPLGVIDGSWSLLIGQLVAVAVTAAGKRTVEARAFRYVPAARA